MNRVRTAGVACVCLAVLGSLVSYGVAPVSRFAPDPTSFHATRELSLNGRPAAYNRFVQLTPAMDIEAGSCWIRRPQKILYGFGTIFQFRLDRNSLTGPAAEFTFVVQSPSDRRLEVRFVPGEIAVAAGHELSTITSTQLVPDFADGSLHTAKIEYTADRLLIYADDLVLPLLAVRIDLDRALQLDHGRAQIGFRSAAIDRLEGNDGLNWAFVATED